MRRTSTHLADGREIFYFDETDAPRRPAADGRQLTARVVAGARRYDPVLDEWVAVAEHRQDRTHLPPAEDCPLCPSGPGRQTEVPAASYDVVVFENRFPAFAGASEGAKQAGGGPLLRAAVGGGRCEVICFTPDHDACFAALPESRVRTVIEAWVDRERALSAIPGVAQVCCFENRGAEIGVTLAHPHGQIYGYPFVTPVTRRMLASAARHQAATGRNLFADVLAAERAAAERVVVAGRAWTAFVPFAARWPVEVHLLPHRRVPRLRDLDDAERDELAVVYPDLLRRLDALYGRPMPYVAAWHQAPARGGEELACVHLRLFSVRRAPDKLKYLAGSESAMGAFVNDVRPERVAELLRAAERS